MSQTGLTQFEDQILALYAKGMSTWGSIHHDKRVISESICSVLGIDLRGRNVLRGQSREEVSMN